MCNTIPALPDEREDERLLLGAVREHRACDDTTPRHDCPKHALDRILARLHAAEEALKQIVGENRVTWGQYDRRDPDPARMASIARAALSPITEEDLKVTETQAEDRQTGGGPCSCGHSRHEHLHDDGEGMPFLGSCFTCRFKCKQYDGTVPFSPTQENSK